jgi:hypothetical protein
VVLFIDHDAEGFVAVEDEAAAGALGGVLTADQVTFDEDVFVEDGQVVHRFGKRVGHLRQRLDGGTNCLESLDALGLFGPTGERHAFEVAREAHAAGENDAIVRSFAA